MAAQLSLEELRDDDWDVVIVGAGPAGATAAAHLARAGSCVLLLDRQGFPRDKVCGDGLIADALGSLGRLGVLAEVRRRGRTLPGTAIYSASRHRIDIAGEFMTIKRVELDAIVAARAVEDGATFARGAVARVQAGREGVLVEIAGRAAPLRTQYALIATGADDALLRRTAPSLEASRPSAIALRCYVRSTARVDRLVISYGREILPGYAWIFPLRGGEYNVGCGVFFRKGVRGDVNLRTMFNRFAVSFPEARDVMSRSESATPLKGAPLRCGLGIHRAPEIPRVLAIGETIGTTFPFTGEGIGKAMETGELAARTVRDAIEHRDPSRLHHFGARIEREFGPRYLGYRAAERWLSRPWITDIFARRARESDFLRSALGGILNETIDPRTVFSLRGLTRALLS